MTARPRHHRFRPFVILALIPLLAGCGGLLSSPPKRQLYRVNPTLAFAAGLPHVAAQLVVAQPSAPAGLDTERIALSRAPLSLDYFADAQWADRMPFLVQSALVEGFEKSAAIPGVGPDNGSLSADFVLETAIRDFEAIYDAPDAPPHISVALDAKLIRMPARRVVAQISVSRDAKASANAVPDVVAAFDSALGGAVTQVVTWTLDNPALSERQGSVRSPVRFAKTIGGAAH